MDGLHQSWGEKVRELRKAFNMSQQDLAERCTEMAANEGWDMSMAQSTISAIESGQQAPTDRQKWLLAGVLRQRVDRLFALPAVVPPFQHAFPKKAA